MGPAMQAERWKKVEELFEAARQQPADGRAGFLRQACPGDPELCAEVESLLKAAESGDPLLDGSPLSSIAERAPALKPGDQLGSFEILGLIGRGGMGEVYRARDPRLKREVAIKTLPPTFAADRDRVARFEREARAASALNHPNIVSVHDIGHQGDVWFIVSELVDGETLARVLERGPLPLRKLIEVGTQIAEGLAAAHAAGVVHRDLKPGNIMLTCDGRVKILDFGLARQDRVPGVDSTTLEVSQPGLILGTPGYMAPEQVRGEATDARSDLFSLGVILYEMASGKRAFSGGSSIEVMNSILKDDPPELPPASPPALDRLVRRCIEKEPARRFHSAADLGFAVGSIGASSPIAAPARKRASWRVWTAAAALCCCVAAGIAYWLWVRSRAASDSRPENFLYRLTRDAGFATGAAISPDGRLVAYASDRSDPSNLDIWVQHVGASGKSRGGVRITDDPADDYDPAFSPDGAQIAFRSDRDGGGIYAVPTTGGEARLLVSRGGHPRFSPDGRMLMYTTGSFFPIALFIQGDPGTTPVQIGAGCDVAQGIWSPDGRRVLLAAVCPIGGSTNIRLWVSTLDGKRTPGPSLRVNPGDFSIDQWLADPPRLLMHIYNGDGASIATIPVSEDGTKVTGPWQRVTFSTDNEGPASAALDGRVVFSSGNREVHNWGIPIDGNGHATGAPQRLTSRPAGVVETSPVLSRDGRHLAFGSVLSDFPTLFYKNLSTGKERELASDIWVAGGVFNPDATMIIFHGAITLGSFSAYEVPVAGGAPRKLWEHPEMGQAWDWSPDGTTVLCLEGYPNGKVVEMDLKSLSKTTLLDDPGFGLYQAHFSNDGRWVTFNATSLKEERSRVYVAPFRKGLVPRNEWIAISDSGWDDKPHFSHDDNLLFFSSDRDGFRCIWAQRLGPGRHPSGEPFPVYHCHERRRSLKNLGLFFAIAVGPDRIVFNQAELTGNIWLRKAGYYQDRK
jgi:eukaryotic-like serine/threonine-protein kinase